MKVSLDRIGKQAKKFKLFNKIFLYTEKELPGYAHERCEKIIKLTNTRRGYGYWSWKPAIILDVIEKAEDGDIIFYSDAGSHLNAKGKNKLLEYIEKAKAHDIWTMKLRKDLNDINYSKADLVEYFKNDLPSQDILSEGQNQATNIILVKNEYTKSIFKQYNELMNIEHLHLFDDSPSEIPNSETFVEHRHDQSIFSLLMKTNHCYSDTDCKAWAPDEEGWKILEESEPILNKRDKVRGQYLSFRDKISIIYHKISSFNKTKNK